MMVQAFLFLFQDAKNVKRGEFVQETLQCNLTGENTTRRRFLCPLCSKHTVLWLLPDTEIKNLPIKCKLCGKESIINIEPLK